MTFSSWRGTVGLIKPTMRPGGLEELIRLLPEGIGVLPILQNVRAGTREEFVRALPGYYANAKRLVEAGADLVHHSGTPPFMLQGYRGEAKLIRKWERELGVPMFTANQMVVRAFRVLGAKRVVGASYSPLQNRMTVDYLTEAGFDVLAMEPIDVPFEKAGEIAPEQVYAHVRRIVLKHPKAQAIYLQGNAWRLQRIVQMMEDDFAIPVVETDACLCWENQTRLRVREPRDGIGRLLRELP
jgi:maleate cis-trans isomerase